MADAFVGEIRILPYANKNLSGWVPCDGRLLPIGTYQALFALLGTRFGGDGANNFGVPDMQGRLPVGQGTLTYPAGGSGSSYALGAKGGAETVALTQAEGVAHTHTLLATTATSTTNTPGNTVVLGSNPDYKHYAQPSTSPTYGALANEAIANAGGNQSHNNVMPSLGLQFFICANGIYPTQS